MFWVRTAIEATEKAMKPKYPISIPLKNLIYLLAVKTALYCVFIFRNIKSTISNKINGTYLILPKRKSERDNLKNIAITPNNAERKNTMLKIVERVLERY